ncbi:MAG: hypothetical protein E6K13_09020 [Methanobacteriota archaeon]|nr:MAG: hypothetical protein E6K13_09020 [Euryarchaeota archaeon]
MPMYPPAPKGALRFMGIPIGVLLLVGLAALQAAVLLPRPLGQFGGQPDPATQAYLDAVRLLSAVALGSMDTAVAMTVMFAWHGAIARPDLSEATRRGILTFAAVFVAAWVIIAYLSISFFSFLFLFR